MTYTMAISRLQLTLAILKPHVVSNPLALHEIRHIIARNGFRCLGYKKHRFNLNEADKFYAEHRNKFFYNRLVTFMTSGTSEMYILAREDAISVWRKLMGPTKVFKTQFDAPDSIRGKFGLSDTRNATHGSDSMESAKREIQIFFPEFDFDNWHENKECLFETGLVQVCDNISALEASIR